MILIIIAVGIGSYFTMKDVNNGAQPSKMENQEMSQDGQNEPPAKPEENGENTSSEKNNQSSKNTIPAKPEENSQNTSSEKSNQSNQSTPPEKPEQNSDSNNENTQPQMQNGESNQTMTQMNEGENQQTPPQMPSGEKQIEGIYYVLFAIEGIVISTLIIYLIMSKFNKLTFSQTLEKINKKVICLLYTSPSPRDCS